MEDVEQYLISKFRPEAQEDTVYRTMREAERRAAMKQEYKVKPMSKDAFLRDLRDQIESVPWKEKSSNHKATVRSRPGISRMYQEELDSE
jgi:hypothetical protein